MPGRIGRYRETLRAGSRKQRGACQSIRPSELGAGRELPSQSKSAEADDVPIQLYQKPLGRTSAEDKKVSQRRGTAKKSTPKKGGGDAGCKGFFTPGRSPNERKAPQRARNLRVRERPRPISAFNPVPVRHPYSTQRNRFTCRVRKSLRSPDTKSTGRISGSESAGTRTVPAPVRSGSRCGGRE